jgi:putative ABC transport system permease protein
MAVDPAAHPEPGSGGSEGGRPAVELGEPLGEGVSSSFPLYVATPDPLLGALLGIAGAYLALTAGYRSDLGSLSRVPVLDLTVIAVGLPLLAALASWLLAGREPPSIARQPLQ